MPADYLHHYGTRLQKGIFLPFVTTKFYSEILHNRILMADSFIMNSFAQL